MKKEYPYTEEPIIVGHVGLRPVIADWLIAVQKNESINAVI
jgi:hypothetical protein